MTNTDERVVTDTAVGQLEVVHLFEDAMPTGVTVSRTGRIFVCYPKWGDEIAFTVGELRDGKVVAYPSQEFNENDGNTDPDALVSVQSVVVDPADRLWLLDTGSPMFRPTSYGGPKLVCVDLATDRVAQTILFPAEVALPTTYLNDVRFDLRQGEAGAAYITDSADSGPNGIIVVDLATGRSWRRLHDHPSTKALTPPQLRIVVEGEEFLERSEDGSTSPVTMGADGIAIAADGSRLYYCTLAGRRLYSVATLTGVHFAQPAEATRARCVASVTAAPAPFSPTAPISDPPNQAAIPTSCSDRTTVLLSAIQDLLVRAVCAELTGRGRPPSWALQVGEPAVAGV
jgi:sugar lactone lactonase YvrE